MSWSDRNLRDIKRFSLDLTRVQGSVGLLAFRMHGLDIRCVTRKEPVRVH